MSIGYVRNLINFSNINTLDKNSILITYYDTQYCLIRQTNYLDLIR